MTDSVDLSPLLHREHTDGNIARVSTFIGRTMALGLSTDGLETMLNNDVVIYPDYEPAHVELERLRAIVRRPDDPSVIRAYASFLKQQGRLGPALWFIQRVAMSEADWDSESFILRATLERMTGDLESALFTWGRIETYGQRYNDHLLEMRARNGKGLILVDLGQLPEAKALFHQVIEQCVDANVRGFALNNLGLTYEKLGEYANAAVSFWTATRSHRDAEYRVSSLGNLGCALLRGGHLTHAEKAFRVVLKQGTDWQVVANTKIELIDLYSQRQEWDKADQYIAELQPRLHDLKTASQVDYYYRLALRYNREGKGEWAVKAKRTAQNLALAYALGDWVRKLREPEPDPITPTHAERLQVIEAGLDRLLLTA